VLNLLILIGRGLALAFRGHHELVLENLALRQQLVADRGREKRLVSFPVPRQYVSAHVAG
jgi:hypothetical protein